MLLAGEKASAAGGLYVRTMARAMEAEDETLY
jgi:hypothetical protein